MDEPTLKFNQIFRPGLIEEGTRIYQQNGRFVYYTSAETAMKILRSEELWFRNTNVMNDFSEISYGIDLIRRVLGSYQGQRFRQAVNDIYLGSMERAEELLLGWEHDWRSETYIACVSVHNPEEDFQGRLSMWRAYGNTALVLENGPMMAITDLLAVYSVPVLYADEQIFTNYLSRITDNVLIERRYLLGLGQDALVGCIYGMLFRFAIATKHPGFKEEKEWRLFYRPTERKSPGMSEEVVVLGGIPQKVYKLRLANEPHNGLHAADIPSLLNRIIIGPTPYPYVSYKALVQVLSELHVPNPESKVIVSSIPLRTN